MQGSKPGIFLLFPLFSHTLPLSYSGSPILKSSPGWGAILGYFCVCIYFITLFHSATVAPQFLKVCPTGERALDIFVFVFISSHSPTKLRLPNCLKFDRAGSEPGIFLFFVYAILLYQWAPEALQILKVCLGWGANLGYHCILSHSSAELLWFPKFSKFVWLRSDPWIVLYFH